jgi:septal ring factor EnvC (AmiA/AmiB activator)
MLTGRAVKGAVPVLQLTDLSRASASAPRPALDPSEAVRQAIDVVRKTYEDIQSRALDLQKTIRREEHTVEEWRRKIRETEEQLARWQPVLAEAEARLEQARREFAALAEQSRESAALVSGVDRGSNPAMTNGDARRHRVA